jgi:hypothetical protein
VQLRFQVFNEDGQAHVTADGIRFSISRPLASLNATTDAHGGLSVQTGKLTLPDSEGTFPYAEITSASATDHVILTACTASPAGEAPGRLQLARDGAGWQVSGTHRDRAVHAAIAFSPSGEPMIHL